MYLLDTNIISEIHKKAPNQSVINWYYKVIKETQEIYISVLTLGELQKGVKQLEKKDQHQAKVYAKQLQKTIEAYADYILPIYLEDALEWGDLSALNKNVPIDTLIAAQAKTYGLILVTRNTKHVKDFNIPYFNPFDE